MVMAGGLAAGSDRFWRGAGDRCHHADHRGLVRCAERPSLSVIGPYSRPRGTSFDLTADQDVPALMPSPDAVKPDSRVVAVGTPGPHSALTLKSRGKVLLYIVTYPLSRGDVEVGRLPVRSTKITAIASSTTG